MPCSLPRWIGSVLLGSFSAFRRRVSSPTALAFPYTTDGRHPQYSFRGLLELHCCYGLQICSPTFGGLGCEAPMKSVTELHRSSAIQAYRDLLVRDFHPLVIRAARAHVLLQTGWAGCIGDPKPAGTVPRATFRRRDLIILLCVRWYLRYSLTYRDLEEIMAERGLSVDHVT